MRTSRHRTWLLISLLYELAAQLCFIYANEKKIVEDLAPKTEVDGTKTYFMWNPKNLRYEKVEIQPDCSCVRIAGKLPFEVEPPTIDQLTDNSPKVAPKGVPGPVQPIAPILGSMTSMDDYYRTVMYCAPPEMDNALLAAAISPYWIRYNDDMCGKYLHITTKGSNHVCSALVLITDICWECTRDEIQLTDLAVNTLTYFTGKKSLEIISWMFSENFTPDNVAIKCARIHFYDVLEVVEPVFKTDYIRVRAIKSDKKK